MVTVAPQKRTRVSGAAKKSRGARAHITFIRDPLGTLENNVILSLP